jgi:hypothetical protein
MQADLDLKTKPPFWETPRNLAILLGAVIVIIGSLSAYFGYSLGQDMSRPRTIIVHLDGPLPVVFAKP